MESIFIGIIAVIVLYILLRLISVSAKTILKLVWNSIVGLIFLAIFNAVGNSFGLYLEMNLINSLVAGFLGIPGIILLLLFK